MCPLEGGKDSNGEILRGRVIVSGSVCLFELWKTWKFSISSRHRWRRCPVWEHQLLRLMLNLTERVQRAKNASCHVDSRDRRIYFQIESPPHTTGATIMRHGLAKDFFIYGLGILSGISCAFFLTELGVSFETNFGLLGSLTYLSPIWGISFFIFQSGKKK